MADWENIEIKDLPQVIEAAVRKEEMHEIGSTYVVTVFETGDGKFYVTDNYAIEENLVVERESWDDALTFGKSFIHDTLPPPPVIPLREEGVYIAHWGLTDLYEDAEAKLKELLAGGEDFDTGWDGSKKELDSMQIIAQGDTVTLNVSMWMDDIDDGLVTDAATNEDYPRITDEVHDELVQLFYDYEIETEYTATRTFPRSVSYEELMEAVSECLNETDKQLKEDFEVCKNIVWEYFHPGEARPVPKDE